MSEVRVALTFDAEHPSRPGAQSDAADRILDALADSGVRATFFIQGRWATAYPGTARRIAADGHQVGNHSNYHAPMTLLSEEGVRTDLREAARRIIDTTGVDPSPWFRCPFGDGADREDLMALLGGHGYCNVHWDLDPGDWEEGATSRSVHAAVADGVRALGRSTVVLLHTWSAATAAALPSLLSRLQGEGASLVPIGELDDGA